MCNPYVIDIQTLLLSNAIFNAAAGKGSFCGSTILSAALGGRTGPRLMAPSLLGPRSSTSPPSFIQLRLWLFNWACRSNRVAVSLSRYAWAHIVLVKRVIGRPVSSSSIWTHIFPPSSRQILPRDQIRLHNHIGGGGWELEPVGLRKPRLSGEIRQRKWIDVGWSEGKIKPRTIGVVTPVDLSDPLRIDRDRLCFMGKHAKYQMILQVSIPGSIF